MDLNADLGALSVAQLLERQQELSRTRIAVNAAQRATQAELDRRQREIADRRAAEDQLLGQVTKPPTQDLFGTPPELGAGDEPDAYDFVEANEQADMLADELADREAGR